MHKSPAKTEISVDPSLETWMAGRMFCGISP